MSDTFTKLFSSITDSTIWVEDNETRIVWITMLAMADQTGYVGASVPGLAARARISVEATRAALVKFMSPDPDSRSKEHDGRRVEEVDRGWVLLNYEHFREMRDEGVRREYDRMRKRRQRKRPTLSQSVPACPKLSPNVTQCLPASAQAEAEAEADPDQIGCSEPRDRPAPAEPTPAVFTFPLTGGVGWSLGREAHDGFAAAFPGVPLEVEYAKAVSWLNANPLKRKTPRGMPQFLFRWLERAQNRGSPAPTNGANGAHRYESFQQAQQRVERERAASERERVRNAENAAQALLARLVEAKS